MSHPADTGEKNTSNNSPIESSVTSSSVPYETALAKAFDKLTSEIFVFLLAYMILIIGLATLGQGIPDGLRGLLYIIPILGILAYGWSRKRTVTQDPGASGINVRAIFVKDGYVGGIRGSANSAPNNVDVSGGFITGGGTVIGVDQPSQQTGQTAQFLVSIFDGLDENDQDEIIQYALKRKASL